MASDQGQPLQWRKSSYSLTGGNCVEVACDGSRVLIRDSNTDPDMILSSEYDSWRIFIDCLKGGTDKMGWM